MIGVIFSNNLNTCPYIDKYLDIFQKKNVQFEVILWDRDGSEICYPDNYHIFKYVQNVDLPKIKKISGFCKFMSFVYKIIHIKKYDKLIFLTTQVALICYPLALTRFRKRYIFDFRDLSFENHYLYRVLVKNIINQSFFTCMSSPEFAKVFSYENYVMAHNFRYKDLNNRFALDRGKPSNQSQIVLLHIGISRGEEYNRQLVHIFGGDIRFKLYIIGRGNDSDSLLSLASKYNNVVVQGTYDNEEKQNFIKSSDLLLYYYPCDFNCNRALANKYYDSLIYRKPLVGNINTYSGRRLQEKGLGVSVDLSDERCADRIYDYYKEYNQNDFEKNVESELSIVLKEDMVYIDKIKQFVAL